MWQRAAAAAVLVGVLAACAAPGEAPDRFGSGAQVCAAVPLAEVARVIADPEAGEPRQVWGRVDRGECRWENAAFDIVTVTVKTDPFGADAARDSVRHGSPVPGVGEHATLESSASRVGRTVTVTAWLGGPHTFEVQVRVDARIDEDVVVRFAAAVAQALPASGVFDAG